MSGMPTLPGTAAGRLLVVTAVEPERDAVLAGLAHAEGRSKLTRETSMTFEVIAGGVGPAAAAAATARALALAQAASQPFGGVLCAGIAGGFPGRVELGATVLASRSVAADLGALTPDGFVALARLGFGPSHVEADAGLLTELEAALPNAVVGEVLAVSTVTGTAAGRDELLGRHPAAVAEAMEGFGVAIAATQAGVGFAELRTISNLVGPRDRAAWRIGPALSALTQALAGMGGRAQPRR
jgi:futalosine hydrolase